MNETTMKRLTTLAVAAMMTLTASTPALARYGQRGYSEQCFEDIYREEYIPGTRNRPGRVRRWTEQKEVACNYGGVGGGIVPERHTQRGHVDDNSCVEGAVLGGILGGAGGAAATRRSTENDMVWAIPLGVVVGAIGGCQLDGG